MPRRHGRQWQCLNRDIIVGMQNRPLRERTCMPYNEPARPTGIVYNPTTMKTYLIHALLAMAFASPAFGQFEVFQEEDAPSAASTQAATTAPAAAPAQRVLMLLADDFAVTEFWWPYYALRAAGYEVDVAALAAGSIRVDDRDRQNDVIARLSLDEADGRSYAGLVIPGGRVAEKLEKFPRALDVVRQFAKLGKVLAASGHGPRLMVKAGVLNGRFVTHPWQLATDLADDWKAGAMGYFVDEPAVVDGGLVTGRGSDDLLPFMQEVIRSLDGNSSPKSAPRVVVVNPSASRHLTWAFGFAMEAQGCSVRTLGAADLKAASPLDANAVDVLVVLDGRELADLADAPGLAQCLAAMQAASKGGRVLATGKAMTMLAEKKLAPGAVELAGRPDQQALRAHAIAVKAAGPIAAEAAKTQPCSAAIVIQAGCDEKVVASMKTVLSAAGHRVVVLAAKAGYVRGMYGLPIKADAAFGDFANLASDAVIVAPGGLWPRTTKEHQARVDWLLARYKAGARLAACGYDNVYLAADAGFAGKTFAAPDQAQWSFDRQGGQFSSAKSVLAADRFISAKDFDALGDAMKLIADWKPGGRQ